MNKVNILHSILLFVFILISLPYIETQILENALGNLGEDLHNALNNAINKIVEHKLQNDSNSDIESFLNKVQENNIKKISNKLKHPMKENLLKLKYFLKLEEGPINNHTYHSNTTIHNNISYNYRDFNHSNHLNHNHTNSTKSTNQTLRNSISYIKTLKDTKRRRSNDINNNNGIRNSDTNINIKKVLNMHLGNPTHSSPKNYKNSRQNFTIDKNNKRRGKMKNNSFTPSKKHHISEISVVFADYTLNSQMLYTSLSTFLLCLLIF